MSEIIIVCRGCGTSFSSKQKNRVFCTRECWAVHQAPYKSHGESKTRLNRIWCDMRRRCNPKNAAKRPAYSGRGVSVFQEWNNYLVFREWALSNGYNDSLEIDRINNDGNYEPSNCRWVSHRTNILNRRKYRGKKSVFRGVTTAGKNGRFFVGSISIEGNSTHSCSFQSELWAAMHYDRESIRHRGLDARLNFPERVPIYLAEIERGCFGLNRSGIRKPSVRHQKEAVPNV